MANRHENRAKATVEKKLPQVPNLSGTDEACGNCKNACMGEHNAKIIAAMDAREKALAKLQQRPAEPPARALPDDEAYCLLEPAARQQKTWAWCSHWRPR